jgi:hypothetical protein
MVVRKRRHNSLQTMLYLRDVAHANQYHQRLEAMMMRQPGTLRKRWRFRHGHKTMMLRHQSRGIPTSST